MRLSKMFEALAAARKSIYTNASVLGGLKE